MSHNFAELIKATTNARQGLKLLAASHYLEGKSRTEIAICLKVSRSIVNIWIKSNLDFGLKGLDVKPRSGNTGQTEVVISETQSARYKKAHRSELF